MHLVKKQETRPEVHGLAGWLLTMWSRRVVLAKGTGRSQRKHMRVVETLPMGPKRQLFLVSCDGERFLVGSGPDTVQTIVRVRAETAGQQRMRGSEPCL